MRVIIDGHSIAYRVYYKTPKLTNSRGIPTSVVHTFLNILLSLKEELNPEEIIVTFDSKGKTERHGLDEEYKANRQPAPEDLIPQIEILKNAIPLLGVNVFAKEGVEADDIIFTLSEDCEDDVYIVTKDKDIYQLVNDRVKIYDYQNNKVIGIKEVVEKFEVTPEQIPDFLALVGDASDNIPGVKGIGPKTAAPLLKQYGSLENIYENLDDLKSSVRDKLEKYKDDAFLSKELTEPIRTEIDFDRSEKFDESGLLEFLEKYELNQVKQRLFGKNENIELGNDNVGKPDLAAFVEGLFYTADSHNYNEEKDFKKAAQAKYVFSYKNIYKHLQSPIKNVLDLELISWLNDPDSGGIKKQKEEDVGAFLKRLNEQSESIFEEFKKNDFEEVYENIEITTAEVLACMEIDGIKLSKEKLEAVDEELAGELNQIEEKIFSVLNKEINLNSPKQLSEVLFDELGIKPYKKTKTGYSTNEESLKNLIIMNPGYAELLELILTHREYSKLKNTYTGKLGDYVNPETGRVHSTFNQVGTATGRLSSSNPNLQNIPQRGKIASRIRSAFIPEDGYSLISFDYSQIELRLLAHLSGDKTLLEAYEADADIHKKTAASIFNIGEEDVDSSLRRIAKAVNFGIIYGLSPYGLARDTGVSQKEAKEFIDKYFKLYPKVDSYIKEALKRAKELGYTETIFGRKRFVRELSSKNKALSSRAERIAINAPIQGSAADIIKKAMLDTFAYLANEKINGRLILQVHDELIFEIKDGEVDRAFQKLKDIMEKIVHLDVNMSVKGKIGKDLGALK
ncbi:MAG: DNA polymerase I [Flexistipes sinusarabici]|uniref:DNA polymerase I n=1 Tax=Flexistipes sinusarabici TaxID=2352 RepID=A0A5D0MM17_FLESI|nr:DNA polymerase I [Flexistipes sinusarabici]TYB34704.1 MAG: DNA polymerase I [Flexistipes sinusarabici]